MKKMNIVHLKKIIIIPPLKEICQPFRKYASTQNYTKWLLPFLSRYEPWMLT
jgi:hypothetical protein